MMETAFPFRIDGRGRTAQAGSDEHIRQMIEQVLFTSPGERVNRPDFGTGVLTLIFGPNSPELATATEFTIQGALQQWLGDRIELERVQVESQESTLRITVAYRVRRNGDRQVVQFEEEV